MPERVRDLLGRMTLEEKFWQLYMSPGDLVDPAHDWSHGVFGLQVRPPAGAPAGARAHAERINAVQRYFVERTRLGIPMIPFEEALHGLAADGATVFPQAIALAASWDAALVARVAEAIAQETSSRGIRQALSPVVNLADDVRWGRVEETYGEDPYLASAMGRAFVGAFERAGLVATPKHLVANVGAGGRDSYPIDHSRRLLEEVYLPPFTAAIREGGARSVMTAYNSVDGVPATQNAWLLTDVLRTAWGFTGVVISDAAATGGPTVLQMTEPTTPVAAQHAWEAGLDVVFQTSWPEHKRYWEAVRTGLVAESVVDARVANVLAAKFALGLFERPYADPESAARWNGHADHRALALEAARAGIVLLRNARGRLPLPKSIRRIAVIGTDAATPRLGGYSGPGIRPISILDGIRATLGAGATVRYAPGPGRTDTRVAVIPAAQWSADSAGQRVSGLLGEYFDGIAFEGMPRLTRVDPQLDFGWTLSGPAPDLRRDWYSVRWTGRLTVPPGRARRIGVEGVDGWRLYVNGRLVLDRWSKQTSRTTLTPRALPPGSTHDVRLEFHETTGNAHLRLVWDAGASGAARAAIAAGVTAARASEVAVVVAGLEEGEFRDRAFLSLPGRQEDLIRAVAATGTPVVVVLVGGSAITMAPWLDLVDGVIDAWYPGEAGGRAVAEALFGDVNPAGRLPITFPVAEGQLPLVYHHRPTGRGDDYLDLSGEPLFLFGFGLSYTAFAYTDLRIEPAIVGVDGTAEVRCRVRNTGRREGEEVVQVYLRDELASVARPVRALAGFQRVRIAPGESVEVAMRLGPEHLRMLDRDLRWVVEPGTFRVMVGSSSRDIRLAADLTVR